MGEVGLDHWSAALSSKLIVSFPRSHSFPQNKGDPVPDAGIAVVEFVAGLMTVANVVCDCAIWSTDEAVVLAWVIKVAFPAVLPAAVCVDSPPWPPWLRGAPVVGAGALPWLDEGVVDELLAPVDVELVLVPFTDCVVIGGQVAVEGVPAAP